VTLEDILEQLVGDIWDEHDQVTSPVRPLGSDRWEIAGDATVEEVFEALCEDDDLPETDAATVAGLALEHLEHIPVPGERFTCGRLELGFEVLLQPWDYAAAACIIEVAGGRVTQLDGTPITLDRPCSILAGNAVCHREFFEHGMDKIQ
jgi:CBS domain containing-hemolysin-like protein